MAFEDRCSPNQANSPGPNSGRVPAPHSETTYKNYTENQYTCTTIDQRYERNMTIVKIQPSSPPPSPQEYYQEKELKPVIEEEKRTGFYINDILRPDFGSSAIKKSSIYKPYDLSKHAPTERKSNDYSRYMPLGGLKNAISQIDSKADDRRTTVEDRRPDSANSMISTNSSGASSSQDPQSSTHWPAWVYCTRYSDRPSSGPRSRRMKKKASTEEKRPRTAFSASQLARLKHEFAENRYLTERRRQALAAELGLAEAQIKIWFQNKRAKLKKSSGQRHPLALQLMAQGLYNHSTAQDSDEDEEINVA